VPLKLATPTSPPLSLGLALLKDKEEDKEDKEDKEEGKGEGTESCSPLSPHPTRPPHQDKIQTTHFPTSKTPHRTLRNFLPEFLDGIFFPLKYFSRLSGTPPLEFLPEFPDGIFSPRFPDEFFFQTFCPELLGPSSQTDFNKG
jgi:hypothetical protein